MGSVEVDSVSGALTLRGWLKDMTSFGWEDTCRYTISTESRHLTTNKVGGQYV